MGRSGSIVAGPGGGPGTEPAGRSRARVRVAGYVAGVALVVVVAAAVVAVPHLFRGGGAPARGDRSGARPAAAQWVRPTVSPDGLIDRVGVRIVHVAVTGEGGLVDLRFQVVDPDKAAAVHSPTTPPGLIDEGTGVVVKDLFMGHSHHGTLKQAVTYYLIFENPGNLVRAGSHVTVLLGDAQVAHVPVQ